jgi:hypothetical protein
MDEQYCYDRENNRIQPGDYVYIVGDCKLTDENYVVTDDMKPYINSGKCYKIYSIDAVRKKVHINGYMWHPEDLCVGPQREAIIEPKVTRFKFDEKLLDL